MHKLLSAVLIVLLFCMTLFGQENSRTSNLINPSELVQKPTGFLRNLIDPAKFTMTHNYSLSLISSGKRSYNQGLYLNTMTYRFSDPLLMQLKIGYLHQPLGGNAMLPASQQGSVFIQGAHLLYKPTENMYISVDYESYPSMLTAPYWGRW